MTKAIIFDCFGVFTADLWKEFVSQLPSDQAAQASSLNHAYDAGILSREDFLSEVEALTGRVPQEVEQLLDQETNKNTELLKYVRELSENYKIGMLSNIATNWVRDSFLTDEEQKLFDDFLFSHEVGMTKPDPRIFQLAADRLGVAPEECIFVDDIERYCTAAEGVGMQSIHYQNFRQLKTGMQAALVDAKS